MEGRDKIPSAVLQRLQQGKRGIVKCLGSITPGAVVPLQGVPDGTHILAIGEDVGQPFCTIAIYAKISGSWLANTGCWRFDSSASPTFVNGTQSLAGAMHGCYVQDKQGKQYGFDKSARYVYYDRRTNQHHTVQKISFYEVRERGIAHPTKILSTLTPEEFSRLEELSYSETQYERQAFVLSKHQEGEESWPFSDGREARLLSGLKDEIELVVDTKEGLAPLLAGIQAVGDKTLASRSSLVTLHISFLEPFDPADVTALLQSLGPHMLHLKATCTTAAHCAAIVTVMESCPKEHLRVVSLLGTKNLNREAMDEFLRLSKTGVEVLHFAEMPSEGARTICKLCRQCQQLEIQSAPDDTVADIPFPPNWAVQEVLPVAQLPKGQWAFITADPSSCHPCWVPICVPVDGARTQEHSQLLARMVESHITEEKGEKDSDEPRVFDANGECILNAKIVQLLVAYIENVPPPAADDNLADYPELIYSISLTEEYFLMLLEEHCGHVAHTINTTAVELLGVGNYLQMPALRRLMRSFLVRRNARLPESASHSQLPAAGSPVSAYDVDPMF